MKEHETTRLPPITYDNMPKSIEQQMLAALLRIEMEIINLGGIIKDRVDDEVHIEFPAENEKALKEMLTNITPVETPFSKQPAKNAPQEPRKHRR